ncbi:MAG: glycerol-3-phosphate 1-O-acyltransferase PlsY, partial [Candidatus Pseudothioglobus sp.]
MIYFLMASYLIGSISSAIIICKVAGLPDPRTQGSKNPGATNVLRFGGKKIAAFVLIFDGLKGAIPVITANYFGLSLFELTFILLFAFLGHVFPLFFGFKGGKGVATYLGGLIGINLLIGLTFAIIWLIVAKVLKFSSLAALIATILSPIYFYLITANLQAALVIGLIGLFIIYNHRTNIKRLIKKEEDIIQS